MKIFLHTFLLVTSVFFIAPAQTTIPSDDTPSIDQQDTLKKTSHDTDNTKRVIQIIPVENRTMDLKEIQKKQEEKKQQRGEQNPANSPNPGKIDE